jgi:PAS domain S-box-containing protein
LIPDPSVDFPGVSVDVMLEGTDYQKNVRGLLDEALTELKVSWNVVRFGAVTSSGKGLFGYSTAIDNILTVNSCSNDTYSCYSIDDMMVQIEYQANSVYKLYVNMTTDERIATMNDTFALTESALSKSTRAVAMYSTLAMSQCGLPFPLPIVYVLASVFMLALIIPLHTYVDEYTELDHKLRTLLALIGNDNIELLPKIKDFVYSYHLPSIITKKKKTVSSSTNSVMAALEACTDGALLCTSQFVISDVNTAAKDMFGFSAADIVGCNLVEVFEQAHNNDLEHALLDVVKMGKGTIREYDAVKKSGTKFPTRVSINTTYSEDQLFIVCFVAGMFFTHFTNYNRCYSGA